MNVNLIVAVDEKTMGIGKNGRIPWSNKNDMKWFKETTIGQGNNSIIMGRTTYESIGKPLKDRINIVITHQDIQIPDCYVCHSIEEGIEKSKELKVDSAFIIGGGSIYRESLEKNLIDILYIDYLDTGLTEDRFDTFFNVDLTNFNESLILNKHNYPDNICPIVFYNNKSKIVPCECFDYTYLRLMDNIIECGQTKHTRAGDTLSLFARMMSFDLRNGLPILTTKKVYSKGCIHELLWILHGDTNIKYLVDNNTHIWDDDAYRYYLQKFESDKSKDEQTTKEQFINRVIKQDVIHYIEDGDMYSKTYIFGDLGPVYGKQWVDWNGINQVQELIHKLKTNPDDRRLMISAWNVGEIKDMALPPCHYLSQWYVTEMTNKERNDEYKKRHNVNENLSDKELDELNIPHQYLSCMWMQRSVDTCLGLPYDLLSYSILTHLIAQVCNMVPYEVKCSLGDCHIYKNQLDGAIKQVQRNPFKYKPAHLELNKDIKDINDFKYEDIKIVDYESYSVIKYPLSVGL